MTPKPDPEPAEAEHPRFPDYDSAAFGAAELRALLRWKSSEVLHVNIHPFPFEQEDGANYQLSVSAC